MVILFLSATEGTGAPGLTELTMSLCGSSGSPCELDRQSSSILYVTSAIEGRLSGYWEAQSIASCKRWTISSSTFWYLRRLKVENLSCPLLPNHRLNPPWEVYIFLIQEGMSGRLPCYELQEQHPKTVYICFLGDLASICHLWCPVASNAVGTGGGSNKLSKAKIGDTSLIRRSEEDIWWLNVSMGDCRALWVEICYPTCSSKCNPWSCFPV